MKKKDFPKDVSATGNGRRSDHDGRRRATVRDRRGSQILALQRLVGNSLVATLLQSARTPGGGPVIQRFELTPAEEKPVEALRKTWKTFRGAEYKAEEWSAMVANAASLQELEQWVTVDAPDKAKGVSIAEKIAWRSWLEEKMKPPAQPKEKTKAAAPKVYRKAEEWPSALGFKLNKDKTLWVKDWAQIPKVGNRANVRVHLTLPVDSLPWDKEAPMLRWYFLGNCKDLHLTAEIDKNASDENPQFFVNNELWKPRKAKLSPQELAVIEGALRSMAPRVTAAN